MRKQPKHIKKLRTKHIQASILATAVPLSVIAPNVIFDMPEAEASTLIKGTLRDLSNGDIIRFNGADYILLDKTTGFIAKKVPTLYGIYTASGGSGRFNDSYIKTSVDNIINSMAYNSKELLYEKVWGSGYHNNETTEVHTGKMSIMSYDEYTKYNTYLSQSFSYPPVYDWVVFRTRWNEVPIGAYREYHGGYSIQNFNNIYNQRFYTIDVAYINMDTPILQGNIVIPNTVESDFEYGIKNGEVTIYNYKGNTSLDVLKIPKTLEGYPVTRIEDGAFAGKSLTGTVLLPEGLKYIGDSAFMLNDIKSVNIPSTVTTVGGSAFRTNPNLRKLIIDNGVKEIGDSAFMGTNIGELTIPSSVIKLGVNAFNNAGITKLNLTAGLKIIESNAFYSNPDLTTLVLPDTVTSIGAGAFQYCKLTTAELSENLTTIEVNAFNGNKLTSVVIPDKVTYIGDGAFIPASEYNYTVGNIPIPTLTSLTLGEGLITIGARAFYANKLTSLVIPDNVTTIGKSAFSDGSYIYSGGGTITTLKLGAKVKTIGDAAFQYNKITTLNLPDTVDTIGAYAFSGNKITMLTTPRSLQTIGSYAFESNPLLTLKLNEGLKHLGDYTFNVTKLASFKLPSTVTSTGSHIITSSYLTRIDVLTNALPITFLQSAFNGVGNVGLTIYGYKNSTAETFANQKGAGFVALNAPPTIPDASITVKTLGANKTTTIPLNATDTDGDEIEYSVTSNNTDLVTASVTQAGVVTLTAGKKSGSTTVRVVATDSKANETVREIPVTITNTAPTATITSPDSLSRGGTGTLTVNPTDVDGSVVTVRSVTSSNPSIITVTGTGNTRTLSSPTGLVGEATITVELEDDGGATSQVTKKISVGNSSPTVPDPTNNPNYILLDVSSSFTLVGTASDLENDGMLAEATFQGITVMAPVVGGNYSLSFEGKFFKQGYTNSTLDIAVTDTLLAKTTKTYTVPLIVVDDKAKYQQSLTEHTTSHNTWTTTQHDAFYRALEAVSNYETQKSQSALTDANTKLTNMKSATGVTSSKTVTKLQSRLDNVTARGLVDTAKTTGNYADYTTALEFVKSITDETTKAQMLDELSPLVEYFEVMDYFETIRTGATWYDFRVAEVILENLGSKEFETKLYADLAKIKENYMNALTDKTLTIADLDNYGVTNIKPDYLTEYRKYLSHFQPIGVGTNAQEYVDFVNRFKETITTIEYTKVLDLRNSVPTYLTATLRNALLEDINVRIAEKAIENVAKTLTVADRDLAETLINGIKSAITRAELKLRLGKYTEQIDSDVYVTKAENTLIEKDLIYAQEVVNNLPSDAPNKTPLTSRLNKVSTLLDAVKSAEKTPTTTTITNAQNLLNNIPNTATGKQGVQNRIDMLLKTIEVNKAKDAITLAENLYSQYKSEGKTTSITLMQLHQARSNAQSALTKAQGLFNDSIALSPELETKNNALKATISDITARINQLRTKINSIVVTDIQDELGSILDGISDPEQNGGEPPSPEEVEDRIGELEEIISDLPDSEDPTDTTKQDLLDQLNAIIEANNIVKAELKITELDNTINTYNTVEALQKETQALEAVSVLKDGETKTTLTTRLQGAQEKLRTLEAVVNVTKTINDSYTNVVEGNTLVQTTVVKVNALQAGVFKTELTNRLMKAQARLDALDETTKLETSFTNSDKTTVETNITQALSKINAFYLTDATNFTKSLQDRVQLVQVKLDARTAVEQVEVENNLTTIDTKKLTNLLTTATEKMNKVTDTSYKSVLSTRLTTVQTSLDAFKASLTIAQQQVSKVVAMSRSVDENDKNALPTELESAKTLVNALKGGQDKQVLLDKLNAVEEYINNYDAFEQTTINLVVESETEKTQDTVDKANTNVEMLLEGLVKEELTSRLIKVQSYINADKAITEAREILTEGTFKTASDLLNNLAYDAESKASLTMRLSEVKTLLDTIKEIKAVSVNSSTTDITNAHTKLQTIDNTERAQELTKHLKDVELKIEARGLVEKAVSSVSTTDISTAVTALDKVSSGEFKNNLLHLLTVTQQKLTALTKVEETLQEADYTNALSLVDAIPVVGVDTYKEKLAEVQPHVDALKSTKKDVAELLKNVTKELYTAVRSTVEGLRTSGAKSQLITTLDEVNYLLGIQADIVELDKTLSKEKYQSVYTKLLNTKNSTFKTKLLTDLSAVNDKIAVKEIETTLGTVTDYLYNFETLTTKAGAISNPDLREATKSKITTKQQNLFKAKLEKDLEKVGKSYNATDYNNLLKLLEITTIDVKPYEAKIKDAGLAVSINELVTTLTKGVDAETVSVLETLTTKLTPSIYKIGVQKELAVFKDTLQKEEARKKEDALVKEIQEVLAKAKGTLDSAFVVKAEELLKTVTSIEVKSRLEKELQGIKDLIQDKESQETLVRDIKGLLVQAKTTKSKEYLTKAIDLLPQVKNTTIKATLQQEINEVTALLEKIETPTEPTKPTEPVESTPVEPTPVESVPIKPVPVKPTPVEPTPVDPKPVDPKPVDPKPTTPTVPPVVKDVEDKLKDVVENKDELIDIIGKEKDKEVQQKLKDKFDSGVTKEVEDKLYDIDKVITDDKDKVEKVVDLIDLVDSIYDDKVKETMKEKVDKVIKDTVSDLLDDATNARDIKMVEDLIGKVSDSKLKDTLTNKLKEAKKVIVLSDITSNKTPSREILESIGVTLTELEYKELQKAVQSGLLDTTKDLNEAITVVKDKAVQAKKVMDTLTKSSTITKDDLKYLGFDGVDDGALAYIREALKQLATYENVSYETLQKIITNTLTMYKEDKGSPELVKSVVSLALDGKVSKSQLATLGVADVTTVDLPKFVTLLKEKVAEIGQTNITNEVLKDLITKATPTNKLATAKKLFDDIENHWAADRIKKLVELGVIESGGLFKPQESITRAQYAVILSRTLGLKRKGDNPFKDISGAWYEDYVVALYEKGLTYGDGDGLYNPNSFVTRQQSMTMLGRLIQAEGTYIKDVKDLKDLFKDVSDLNKYAVEPIKTLVSAGVVHGVGGKLLPNDYLSKAQMAKIVSKTVEFVQNGGKLD